MAVTALKRAAVQAARPAPRNGVRPRPQRRREAVTQEVHR
jgi:hypothetical protein